MRVSAGRYHQNERFAKLEATFISGSGVDAGC